MSKVIIDFYCKCNRIRRHYTTLDQRFQRVFKTKQPFAGRANEASEGGGTSGHPGP